MSEDWAAVAADVATALAEVGFTATLEEPGENAGPEYDPIAGAATEHSITVVDDETVRRDATGTITGSTRVLTVAAGTVTPMKGWRVQVRGTWHRIAQVRPLAPGGVDLLFDLYLEG